ncbi:MAG: lysozyme inhibitor LprI family protein [Pseudomonas sp.]|uniref:lysozyme inhibitor LprI family protein n=1 Tax=Pseudomonas sp. TaxID=306 RepID=UPI003981E6CA
MIKKIYIGLAFLIPILSSADETLKASCREMVNSQQIYDCSKIEREAADKILNDSYKTLLTRVKDQYKPSPELGDEFIEKIKVSQRLWIKLRDADCILDAFQIETGSQAYETTVNKCVARLSEERSRHLEENILR